MSDIASIPVALPALEFIMTTQHQPRHLTNTMSAPLPTLLPRPAIVSGDGLLPHDRCGLMSKLDTDSEEDSISETGNKVMKNEINMSRTLGLKKRINNEDIKQKFLNLENEHKKIHTQIKSLQNNLMKRDQAVNELSLENTELNKKYESLIVDINQKNCHLIEYATINKTLEKQLEKKNVELNQLHVKCEKSEQIKSNLIKDIEYYKTELHHLKGQKDHLRDFEELRKKYNEIKRDNIKLGQKFRELKNSDAEHQQKALSYSVLSKKFELLQADIIKFRMENKRLKCKQFSIEQDLISHQQLHSSYKSIENENAALKESIANGQSIDAQLQAELSNLRKDKEQLEKEIKIKDEIINELKDKVGTTTDAVESLKNTCSSTEKYAELLSEQINTYKLKCEALEAELIKFQESKNDSSAEVQALKEEVKKLKIRLGQMLIDKDDPGIRTVSQSQTSQTEDEDDCINCHFLRQEIEKLGYANLRLHKEKLNLKANFQKLSVKTSKLEIKMEELSADKKLPSTVSVVNRNNAKEVVQKEVIIQQNLMLTKKLKDVIENYDKLLKEYILLQQDKIPTASQVESSSIFQELQERISSSQIAITSIEHKLNEEEGKLHASMYHLRSVKNKLSERKMTLK
nr:spindle pole body component 110-like [Onthophagus taurus]